MQSQGRLSVTGSGLQVIGCRGWVLDGVDGCMVEGGADWVVGVGGGVGEYVITVGF